jgi:hypothetical protein
VLAGRIQRWPWIIHAATWSSTGRWWNNSLKAEFCRAYGAVSRNPASFSVSYDQKISIIILWSIVFWQIYRFKKFYVFLQIFCDPLFTSVTGNIVFTSNIRTTVQVSDAAHNVTFPKLAAFFADLTLSAVFRTHTLAAIFRTPIMTAIFRTSTLAVLFRTTSFAAVQESEMAVLWSPPVIIMFRTPTLAVVCRTATLTICSELRHWP